MAESRIGRHTARKPMLDGTLALIAGYQAFHDQEAKYTQIALREMPDAVAIWYRYLTLYDRALRRDHYSPSEQLDDQHRAWDLRLRLASTAGATAKLVLDAALAGYYSQAYALLRHMLETWQVMVYVRFNPACAQLWYSPAEGIPPQEPSMGTVVNRLGKYARQDDELKRNLPVIKGLIVEFHQGAHPTAMAATQPSAEEPGNLQLGGKFDRRFFESVMSKGSLAMALLLNEITRSISVDESWHEEFSAICDDRNRWHEAMRAAEASEPAPSAAPPSEPPGPPEGAVDRPQRPG